MLIYNYIINSRIFRVLPLFLTNFLLRKIVYFSKSNETNLGNNYKISKQNLLNLQNTNFNNETNHKTCSYLSNLIQILFNNNSFCFLDYGCGNLSLYSELSKKTKVNYLIHDQKEITKTISSIIKNQNLQSIYLYENNKNEKIDFLYFGASYQYIENIEEIITNNENLLNSKYILISGIILYKKFEKDKFVVSQHNVQDERKLYFYNENYLINFFKSKNYRVIFNEKNNSDKFINFNNFGKLDLKYSDIFFKKND